MRVLTEVLGAAGLLFVVYFGIKYIVAQVKGYLAYLKSQQK